jgi:hypothetical protein
MMILL